MLKDLSEDESLRRLHGRFRRATPARLRSKRRWLVEDVLVGLVVVALLGLGVFAGLAW